MSVEKLLLHYRRNILYESDPLNWIGPEDGSTAAQTLRSGSVTPYAVGTHKCVRKFGEAYAITDITNAVINVARSGGGNSWRFRFYDIDTDTLLGTVTDAFGVSAFVDGAVLGSASTGIYIILEWLAGPPPVGPNDGDTITLTTDTDPGGLTVVLSGEALAGPGTITWALSATGSTYYAATTSDQTMRHGGYRHTPTGTDKLPYFDITASEAVLAAPFLYSHILDSTYYDELGLTFDVPNSVLQAASGASPIISNGFGQRSALEVPIVFNNVNAIFFNENGDNANAGTWQLPKLTATAAIGAVAGAKVNVVYGGIGATVNGGLFSENITLAATQVYFSKEYGYNPKIQSPSAAVTITAGGASNIVQGWYVKTTGIGATDYCIDYNGIAIDIYDCTVEGGKYGIYADIAAAWNIKRCIVFGTDSSGIHAEAGSGSTIQRNMVYNCGGSGIYSNWVTGDFAIMSNISFNNTGSGFRFIMTGTVVASTIHYNVTYGNAENGYEFTNAGATMNTTVRYNISSTNGNNGFIADLDFTMTYTNSYNNEGSAYNNITSTAWNGNDGVDAREVDPLLIDPANGNFGLSPASTVTHADTGGANAGDIGPILTSLTLNADGITINGIEFDGNEEYFKGIDKILMDGIESTTMIYCRIRKYQGIGFDDYQEGTTAILTDIDNSIADNNGAGMMFWGSQVTVDETIAYRNRRYNFHSIESADFDRVIAYGSEVGYYFRAIANGSSIINSISDGNSLYGINTDLLLIRPTYCCITDAVGDDVDISDDTNFTSSPLFVSVNIDGEDFNIKTVELGYAIDSDCRDAGSDGGDVGAWTPDRSVEAWSMRGYEFEFNPNRVREGVKEKGLIRWRNGLAALDLYATGFKNVFDFNWGGRQPVSKELRLKIKYMSMQIKNRLFATGDERRYFRLHLEKDAYRDLGAAGVVDASERTLTDAAAAWTEFEHQGWHVGIKFTEGTATGTIDAGAKTLTINPDPGFTVNEHVGRFIYHDYNYYYIQSNTSDVLTLLDPEGTLADEAGINWAVELYFKILETDIDGVMTLEDPDGLLVDGTYAWYIDFIEVVLQRPGITWSQPQFDPDKEHSKNGFSILFEER